MQSIANFHKAKFTPDQKKCKLRESEFYSGSKKYRKQNLLPKIKYKILRKQNVLSTKKNQKIAGAKFTPEKQNETFPKRN